MPPIPTIPLFLLLGAVVGGIFSPAAPVTNSLPSTRIALHAVPVAGLAGACDATPNDSLLSCSGYAVAATPMQDYWVYLVAAETDEADLLGVDLRIGYTAAVSSSGFDACASTVYPFDGWPASGGRAILVADTCGGLAISPDGKHTVLGAFSMISTTEGLMEPEPGGTVSNPGLMVADCASESTDLTPAYDQDPYSVVGRIHFGGDGSLGSSPCSRSCLAFGLPDPGPYPLGSALDLPVTLAHCAPGGTAYDGILSWTLAGVDQPDEPFTVAPGETATVVLSLSCLVEGTRTVSLVADYGDGGGASFTDLAEFEVSCSAQVGVGDGGMAGPIRLLGASPNPFRVRSEIRFSLAAGTEVRLDVFDLAGRRVRTLSRGAYPPGEHAEPFDGRDEGGAPVPAGIYLVRLATPEGAETAKLVRID